MVNHSDSYSDWKALDAAAAKAASSCKVCGVWRAHMAANGACYGKCQKEAKKK